MELGAVWQAIASRLGMRFARVPESAIVGASFAAFRRATELPPIDGLGGAPWIAGERDGLGVVVRGETVADVAYTAVAAEIAPAMFVGARMSSPGFGRFLGATSAPDHHGFGELDVFAHDAPRAHLLLDPRRGRANLAPSIGMLARLGPVAIQDGLVEVYLRSFETDEARIAIAVDATIAVARGLSERGRLLRETAADTKVRMKWEGLANEHALTLDWMRRRMRGAGFEIELEPLPNGVLTSVRAMLRHRLGAGLHLRRDPRGRFVAKKSPAPDGVLVGDADFDAQFRIDALVPALAEAALERPEVREILATVASSSMDLVMNDREIVATSTGFLDARPLWARVEALVRAANLVTPERVAGPYR